MSYWSALDRSDALYRSAKKQKTNTNTRFNEWVEKYVRRMRTVNADGRTLIFTNEWTHKQIMVKAHPPRRDVSDNDAYTDIEVSVYELGDGVTMDARGIVSIRDTIKSMLFGVGGPAPTFDYSKVSVRRTKDGDWYYAIQEAFQVSSTTSYVTLSTCLGDEYKITKSLRGQWDIESVDKFQDHRHQKLTDANAKAEIIHFVTRGGDVPFDSDMVVTPYY